MPTVPNAVRLIVCVLVGYGIGRWSALDDFDATTAYSLFTGCLLAVGLYASTYEIGRAHV